MIDQSPCFSTIITQTIRSTTIYEPTDRTAALFWTACLPVLSNPGSIRIAADSRKLDRLQLSVQKNCH
jgi:hypothetical protein